MIVRSYKPEDFAQLKALYLDSSLYGGQFDEARDGSDRLQKKIESDPDSILVAEDSGKLLGTVSLIDDGRVAWLFRFAASSTQVAKGLHDKAIEVLKGRGHTQVLVYTPVGNNELDSRYEELGFTKGEDYTCYWKEV